MRVLAFGEFIKLFRFLFGTLFPQPLSGRAPSFHVVYRQIDIDQTVLCMLVYVGITSIDDHFPGLQTLRNKFSNDLKT